MNKQDEPRSKRKIIILFLAIAIIFTALFYIVNSPVIHAKINGFLSVLTPITLGAAIAYLINPILKMFEFKIFKKIKSGRICRILSIACTYVVVALVITVILWIIIPQIKNSFTDLFDKKDEYISHAIYYVNSIIKLISEHVDSEIREITYADIEAAWNYFTTSGGIVDDFISYLYGVGINVITAVKNIIIALFISFYCLFEKEKLLAMFKKALSAFLNKKGYDTVMDFFRFTDRTFGHFIIGQFIDALIVGTISLILYAILDIPYFFLISFIVAVTNVIPIVGPFIGAIPSAFIIFIAEPEKTIPFIISVIIIQQIDGNIIAPRILGNSTGLSSLGVLIAIVAMSGYFGVLGLYLGVPLFAVLSAVMSKWIDKRLSDKSMSTDTGDYYPENSLMDPYKRKKRIPPLKEIFKKKKQQKSKTQESSGEAAPEDSTEKK